MRTLSRPMFNMGGPIKEGVMHGIREPYRYGSRVGFANGTPVNQASLIQQIKNTLSKQNIGQTVQKVGQEAAKKANMLKRAGSFFTKGIKGPAISESGIMQMAKNLMGWRPTGLPQKIIGAGQRFPKLGPIGAVYGAFKAGEAINKYTKPANQALSLQLQKAGALDPTSPSFGGQFINTGAATRLAGMEQERLDQINKNIQPSTQKGPPGGTQLPSYTDPDKAKNLAKASKDKRVNELLEIMGHKQSKKDAVYNALIDASQIIGAAPGGEGLDISKDIIQPIIGATSKRFDKPKEISEAVRLMQTKAEIEAGMPSTKLKDLIAIGIDTPEKQEAYIRTQLGQPTSFGMAKVTAGKNLTGDNAIDAAAAAYTPDTYQGRLIASKDFKEIKDKQKEKKESDIITEFTEKTVETKDYPDGDYVVGNTLVTVTEGKVSNIRR